MARAQKRKKEVGNSEDKKNNGGNLGFEAKLWAAADKLRGNMEPSDYKHVALAGKTGGSGAQRVLRN